MPDEPTDKKKGGFGAALKGVFFEDDASASAGDANEGETPPVAPTAGKKPTTLGPRAPANGAVNADIRRMLEKGMEAAAHPALTELQKALSKLAKSPLSAGQKLDAALAMLDGDASVDQLLVDIDEAQDALTAQEQKATAAANAARKDAVGGTEDKIRENAARIEELKAEIAQRTADNVTLNATMAEKAASIDKTLNDITATAAVVRADLTKLKQDVEKKKGGTVHNG